MNECEVGRTLRDEAVVDLTSGSCPFLHLSAAAANSGRSSFRAPDELLTFMLFFRGSARSDEPH